MTAIHVIFIMALSSPLLTAGEPAKPPSADWFPKAPPLPAPAGLTIRVTSVDGLFQAAREVEPGGTILVADGHYMMPRYFALKTDDVTLRGESGDRDRVVLDGAESRHGELVGITACSGVTIADLTIQNIKWNGFKLNSNRNVQRATIYNCVIHNIWQRGIKGVAVPEKNREEVRPKDCRVQYCLFYNDRAKRYEDDPADRPGRFGGDYIGGMDIMYATNWTISDNVFIGIQGRTRSARGAIFLWHDSRDCVVERNIIIDCDSGICLGNSHRKFDGQIHAVRCTIRNNFVTRTPEQGILADYTRDCTIVHNTIHHPDNRLKRLIRIVHDNDGLVVANNLLSGPDMRRELVAGKINVFGNVTRVMTAAFVDATRGNLRLRSVAGELPRASARLPSVARDVIGQARPDRPCVGAYEPTSQ